MSTQPTFPTLSTYDLNGDKITLPADFDHDLNLLFVAYLQVHQREVDGWLSFAEQLERETSSLRYYELPVVGKMGAFGRMQLDFWMRQGIPDRETRSRTLTFYVDRARFRQPLGIEHENHIAVLLVNRRGTVLWKAYGGYNPATAAELQAAVQQSKTGGQQAENMTKEGTAHDA